MDGPTLVLMSGLLMFRAVCCTLSFIEVKWIRDDCRKLEGEKKSTSLQGKVQLPSRLQRSTHRSLSHQLGQRCRKAPWRGTLHCQAS